MDIETDLGKLTNVGTSLFLDSLQSAEYILSLGS